MLDSSSVITQATKGIVEDLADELEVSLGRMYEILGKDCSHPKNKRLIRAIGNRDKSPDKWRVRIIKADLDAMFCQIFGESVGDEADIALLTSELFEVIQSRLEGKCRAERLKECREAVVMLNQEITYLEKQEIHQSAFGDIKEVRG